MAKTDLKTASERIEMQQFKKFYNIFLHMRNLLLD